jgi:O-antigen ligase
MSGNATPFDPDFLDHPPASGWLGKLAVLVAMAVLGVGLAMLTALYPIVGVGVTAGLCGLLLVVRVPELLLLAFCVALGVPIQISAAGLPFNAADAILVAWWACVPLILLCHGPHPWRVPTPVKAVLPFVVAVLISILLASNPPGQLKQFMRVVQWFVAVPLAVCVFRPTPRLLRLLGIVLMILPCLFAIDGVVEFFNHGNSISRMIGIPVPAPTDTSSGTIHHTFDVSGRAGSTFGGAQGLAIFIDMLIGVSVAHLVRGPTLAYRVLAVVCLAICGAGLAVAESRGGYMGAAMVVLIIATLMRPRLGQTIAMLGAVAVAAAVLVIALWPGWDGTIASLVPGGRADAVIDRLTIWRTAFDVWRDHPIFGVGLGNFRDHAMQRQIDLLVPLGYESFHAHNTYIELLVDTGVVGLLSYLGFLVAMLAALLRRWRQVRDDRTSHAAIMTMAALGTLGAYVVFAAVDMLLLENTHMLVVLILTIGLLAVPSAPRARPAAWSTS